MQWACLFLPQLALDAALRDADDRDAPLALLDGPVQRRMLHAVSPSARALGLRPGMSFAAAQALGARCRFVELDPLAVERTRGLLAAWAYGYSSHVSLALPHSILLEVGRSRALFGDWSRLQARLRRELQEKGFRHRIVSAPNPHAARVLANVHDDLDVDRAGLQGALAPVPTGRAGLPAEHVQALVSMGLRRLGQLLALPRATVARRFPPTLLQHFDRLAGEPAPLDLYRPPDRFDARIEFDYEVESSQALLFPLRRLTSDLALFLSSRDGGVQRFSLWFEHERRPDSELVIGLLAPERDAGLLFEITRVRVEQVRLPAPVRGLRLHAAELPRFVPASRELFDQRDQQHVPWLQVRERLRARLGDHAVQGVGWRGDHRPERVVDPTAMHVPAQAGALVRPGWLLPEPLAVNELDVRVLAGPERIETGWWDGDDSDVRRDYYVVETDTGRRGWAYRAVRYGRDVAPSPLVLHGWFS